jgi:hypothetical protein
MATRALIGYLDEDRVFTCTYNHYDGYPDHLGKVLNEYFGTELDAEKIANEGYISYIDEDGNIEAQSYSTPDKLDLSREGWEEALWKIASKINSYDAEYAYIWYEGDGAWSEIENMGKRSMVDQLANQLNAASNLWPVAENNKIEEMIPTTPGKIELGDDGEPHVTVMSNVKRKDAMRSVLDILKAELGVETDDAFVYIKTHRDELFDGTVDPFNREEVVDDYNEFRLVNTEYVREEDNIEIDSSDATAGDDAIEKESASGAFEEVYNARGETLKEHFKRLTK